jgi:hypothetical protein
VRSSVDPTRWLPTEVWYPAEGDADAGLAAPHPFGRPHRAGADLPPLHARLCARVAEFFERALGRGDAEADGREGEAR